MRVLRRKKGDESACPALEKVKAALTARGIPSTDSYSLANGSYLTLADHRHVDDILSAGAVTVPALSANPIPVMRCRQIEIEHYFELVVSGLSEGEGVLSSLCRWLTRSFRDGTTKDPSLWTPVLTTTSGIAWCSTCLTGPRPHAL
ncbi:hypothetical protein B0H13DRAFT_2532625 [Mycena leptocephala]|nr:hypothetical protein B0H13DRAFT_2532625 [Mycena leptocephala]